MAAADGSSPQRKRVLRSSDEVRKLLLAAAQDLFLSKGFAAATTRDIATKAGVAEGLLFRHFGTKAKLFEAAVFLPFQEAIESLISQWEQIRATPHPENFLARTFTESVFDLLADRSGQLMFMMMTIEQYNANGDGALANPLLALLDALEQAAAYENGRRGWYETDVRVATRAIFGMVAFNAAFESSLYSSDSRRPSRERILDELTKFAVAGSARPASPTATS